MKAPIIETPRLVLRPWRDEDVPHFVEMHGDPRVMEFYPSTYSADYSRALAARARSNLEQRGYGWWIAKIKDGSRFAGCIVLQDVPFSANFTPAREVGWRLPFDAESASKACLAAHRFTTCTKAPPRSYPTVPPYRTAREGNDDERWLNCAIFSNVRTRNSRR